MAAADYMRGGVNAVTEQEPMMSTVLPNASGCSPEPRFDRQPEVEAARRTAYWLRTD